MNPLFRAVVDAADPTTGIAVGLATLLFMAVFLLWTWWAWAPSRRAAMDAAALLPLSDNPHDDPQEST